MHRLGHLALLLLSLRWPSTARTAKSPGWPVNTSTVNLLGIFPQQTEEASKNGMWILHCRAMFRAAILLARQYNMTFQGNFLGYEDLVTDDDLILTVDHTRKKASECNAVGLIGPAYSNEVHIMASLAKRLGIISVSYSASSPELATIDTGGFYRVVPSDESLVSSMILLFQRFKWKSSIIIHQNDEYGYSGAQLSKQKFGEMSIITMEFIKFDIKEQIFQIDLKKTLEKSLSRIVIVWADEKSTVGILKKALEDALLGSDFVWILTTTVSLDYFDQKQRLQLVGILTVEPVKGDFVDQPVNTTLLNEAYRLWQYYQPETFPGDSSVSSYALFTFDATWALILSLQKLCSLQSSCLERRNASDCCDHQLVNWKQYYTMMRVISFLGVSGEVHFSNTTPDRIGHLDYLLRNIQLTSIQPDTIDYLPVLKWDASLSTWTFYRNQSDHIVWPNLSKKVPADHKLIRGEKLRMVILENPPFIMLKNPAAAYAGMTDSYKQINITEFEGFYRDIMLLLQSQMGFVPVVMLARPTTTFDELVQGVADGLFDTVMTTITITLERNRIVDFSKPLLASSIRVLIRKPTSVRVDLFFFLRPFSLQLWLVLLGTIASSSLLLWCFDRQQGIARSFSHAIHLVFGVEWSSTNSGNAIRFLSFGLRILYIILFAVYTASLLSFIIIQGSKPSISGIDDIKSEKIPSTKVGIIGGTSIENFYLKSISDGVKNYYPLKTIQQMYTSLLDGHIDATLWTNQSAEYYAKNIYCNLIMTVGYEIGHSYYQFPLRRNWLYKDDLDSTILSLLESGAIDRVSAEWFTESRCSKDAAFDTRKKPITLETTGGLFITIFVFSIISIAIHFWSEWNRCRQYIDVHILRRVFHILHDQRHSGPFTVEILTSG